MTTVSPQSTMPLGMNADAALEPFQVASLRTLEDYDLSFVTRRIRRKNMLPDNLIDDAVIEFKRYIALFVLGHRGIAVPCSEVDEVWHTFILFTQEYSQFCQAIAGRFLHHRPYDSDIPPAHAPQDFLAAYNRYFENSELNPVQEKFATLRAGCQGCDDCGVT